MRSRSRKTAWVLAIFAVVFMLASAFLRSFFICHNCSGDHCPICVQIHVWHTVQRLLGLGALYCLALIAAVLIARTAAELLSVICARRTLITLKTKLLN